MHRSSRRRATPALLALVLLAGSLGLPALPNGAPAAPTSYGAYDPMASPCPAGAPVRTYSVASLPLPVSYNNWGDLDLQGELFVPADRVLPLLEDVAYKLDDAGLGTLAEPTWQMRDAFLAGDIDGAVAAATALQNTAAGILADPTTETPRAPVAPSPLATPLVLRAHVGDCVAIRLLNVLRVPTSLHGHALVTVPGAGEALGLNAPDLTSTGEVREYQLYVPPYDGMEGAHFLHSHADSRAQTRHGLFGVLAVEPAGATWASEADATVSDPFGLAAIIAPEEGPAYREFMTIYHDEVELVDWQLQPLPVISPYGEYGPGTKAINLRSEPFYTRFIAHDALRSQGVVTRDHDKSQSYGSYTYGDPGVSIPMSYLGDPTKFRVVNAGPGQPHVHHLHGGGIRWRATPMAEPSQFAQGMMKHNPVPVAASDRRDVVSLSPGESVTLEPEGGSGGVQQSVGDFLFHCHIAEHYLAGMWSFWRVFNTLQPGLAELPDRVGGVKPAVDSTGLLGLQLPSGRVLDSHSIDEWIQAMLPPPGVPGEEDASVWDWTTKSTPQGTLYLGEAETGFTWPNFPDDAPGRLPTGERPAILFDPDTGRLAYPLLKPHFGKRPPFAPEHGPAPYLTPSEDSDHPDGLCPSASPVRDYDVVAIDAPVSYNKFDTDVAGQVFVRAEDRAAAVAPGAEPTSLVLRANAGDCVDVTLSNTLKEKGQADTRRGIHTKTNLHIHLVQFDLQASDGVVAGFNYETTIRSANGQSKSTDRFDPSAPVVTRIAPDGAALNADGDLVIAVKDIRTFFDAKKNAKFGSLVGVGLGLTNLEEGKLMGVSPATLPPGPPTPLAGTITLRGAFTQAHAAGESLGYEFVHYRWYPDVELGVVYFHDHIDGLNTWRRGLFGSLVVEPTGSRWLDPKRTDDQAPDDPTGHVVDVIGPTGSFRELVAHFQERACVAPYGDNCLDVGAPELPNRIDEPAAFNLRSEPLHRRNLEAPFSSDAPLAVDEPSTPFDDREMPQGDPATDILEAYPGDPTLVRLLYAGQSQTRAMATFGVTGHRFQVERGLAGGRTTDALSFGIADMYNLKLECGAGGCDRQAGDFLYWVTQPDVVERGAWGLLRVHDPAVAQPIRRLPSNPDPAVGGPAASAIRHFEVRAVETMVAPTLTQGATATAVRHFVVDGDAPLLDPARVPEPLVLRALPGELVEITLHNDLPSGRVSLHAGMVSQAADMQGAAIGHSGTGPGSIAPGESVTYLWHADREVGVADLVSLADPVRDAMDGLYGALVVEPEGALFEQATGAAADIRLADGSVVHEHVILSAASDPQFESSTMPYFPDVQGLSTMNYAAEPLIDRAGARPATPDGQTVNGAGLGTCHIDAAGCEGRPLEARNALLPFAMWGKRPATPLIEVPRGMPLVLRVTGAAGSQLQAFSVDGHAFARDPDMESCRTDLAQCRSNLVSVVTMGPREPWNLWIPAAGPGGEGDYLYRNHRDAFFEAGMWGLLRVGKVTGDVTAVVDEAAAASGAAAVVAAPEDSACRTWLGLCYVVDSVKQAVPTPDVPLPYPINVADPLPPLPV